MGDPMISQVELLFIVSSSGGSPSSWGKQSTANAALVNFAARLLDL